MNVTFGVQGAPGGAENTSNNVQIRHKHLWKGHTHTVVMGEEGLEFVIQLYGGRDS